MPNSLQYAHSPYLLQHANNPVNWFAWSSEILQTAFDLDKLIIVSIGYSACHWCHVMEHESFEDKEIADIMNTHFVNIKVDREERPDIDLQMMEICQMLTGRGGWPLNVILLPNKKPIYAGAYFPKNQWKQVLTYFAYHYANDREKLQQQAEHIAQGNSEISKLSWDESNKPIQMELMHSAIDTFLLKLDWENGGKQGAPKFIMPDNWLLLCNYYSISNNEKVALALQTTLPKIALGGIFDHVDGGFARYSVDEIWMVPHFEKMLYDNAQLIKLYSIAYAIFKNAEYKSTAEKTIDFVNENLRNPNGLYYSALDADSEGVEGKYYCFTYDELYTLLPKRLHDVFFEYFTIQPHGNWEHTNILHANTTIEHFAIQKNIPLQQAETMINEALQILKHERKNRIKPSLDNKVIASWNAMFISSLATSARWLQNDLYANQAIHSAQTLINQFYVNKHFYRIVNTDNTVIEAFLDDVAFIAKMCLDIYTLNFDIKWIQYAEHAVQYAIDNFYDNDVLFYYASKNNTDFAFRKYEYHDNVISSSNAVMATVLQQLYIITSNQLYKKMYDKMLNYISNKMYKNIDYFSCWALCALHEIEHTEIVITGNNAIMEAKKNSSDYKPNTLLFANTENSYYRIFQHRFHDKKTVQYICKNNVCSLPTILHHE